MVDPLVSFLGVESGDFVGHKRFLALFAGGMLPLISLSFLHMLVKFEEEEKKKTGTQEMDIDIEKLSKEVGKQEAEVDKEKFTPSQEDLKKLEEELRKLNEQKFGNLPVDEPIYETIQEPLEEPIVEENNNNKKVLSYLRRDA